MLQSYKRFKAIVRRAWRQLRSPAVIMRQGITYVGFWPGFDPEQLLLHSLLLRSEKALSVCGPFYPWNRIQKILFLNRFNGKFDLFLSGENARIRHDIAELHIGFWTDESDKVFRFPYWKWNLAWPNQSSQPAYPRFGRRIELDDLTKPIAERFSRDQWNLRSEKAVLITSHLREPRKGLFGKVRRALGCVGFGSAFGPEGKFTESKFDLLSNYQFNLCPENSIGDGYVTEKIVEAFAAGCIPITWCDPQALALDFNKQAVLNLYGLSDAEMENEIDRLRDRSRIRGYLNVPLCDSPPQLQPLIDFLERHLDEN